MNRRLKSFLVVLLVMVASLQMKSHAWADSEHEDHSSDGDGGHSSDDDGGDGNNSEGDTPDHPSTTSGTTSNATTNTNGQTIPSGAISRLPTLDQEQTKQAIDSGKAVSMTMLLTYMKLKYPGDVLDVKLHSTDSKLVYEVRYLSNVIFLRTVYLEAQTLKRL